LFKKWLNRFKIPSLDWIQIEVTSYCNAKCIYCPQTVFQDDWLNRHFPMHSFERLIPVFEKTQLIFLQGWGEPFMCPDLMKMISLAKDAGCRVGTTTNGILLDEKTVRRLIESQLDILCISLAGTDKTNDRIRHGTSLKNLLETIRMIRDIKENTGSRYPEIHIAYLLFKTGMNDLKQLPEMLRGLGVSEVVISTLDFVPSASFESEAIRPSTENEFNALCDQLNAVKEKARQCGINVYYQLVNPAIHSLTCTENIQKALFVSSDGTVSPCVFSNLPVFEKNNQAFDSSGKYQRMVFGNINDDPISEIWRQKAYAKFRKSFYYYNPPEPCKACPKLFIG